MCWSCAIQGLCSFGLKFSRVRSLQLEIGQKERGKWALMRQALKAAETISWINFFVLWLI